MLNSRLLALSRAITPNINEQNEMNTTIITLFLVNYIQVDHKIL